METIGSEPTNDSEQIQTDVVPLSPISEMDETSFADSENDDLVQPQCEPSAVRNLETTDQLSCQELTTLEPEKINSYETGRGDCENGRQLNNQLSHIEYLETELNNKMGVITYLETEYNQLLEYTKLERQIEHEDLVPKEKETLLKNELETLNEKVKYLIQENEDMQNSMQSKDTQIAELKLSLSSCQEVQLLTEKTIKNIADELCPFITGSLKEVLENNPSLQSLIVNNADSRSNNNSVEDILSLIKLFLKYHSETSCKTEELAVKNEDLNKKNEDHTRKIKDLENSCSILKHEKARLESEILTEVSAKTELLYSLSSAQNQLKEVETLLKLSCMKNSKLEKELQNVFNLNDAQVEFQFIIKELDSLLSSWDTNNDLNCFVDTVIANKQLVTCVNTVMNHDSQTNLMNLLKKLRERLKLYDKERGVLNKTVLDLKNHIQDLTNETSDIQSSVSVLNFAVQDLRNIQIKELEEKFDVVVNEKSDLQNKFYEMKKENKYLSEALHDIKNHLKMKNKLLVGDKLDDCKSKDGDVLNCLNCCKELSLEKETIKKKVEELDKLKEMMAIEITCLGSGENKQSILSQSSIEIFNRFMQNIIKKEEEITTSLQGQFKLDLEKAQEKAESAKNKRKSQESWVIVLQNENEAMSRDLTQLKEKSTCLERELKQCSINLSKANSEILNSKSQILELNTDNDTLVVNNEKLLNLLKSERESVSCLENNLRKLKEVLITKEKNIQDLKPYTNIIEHTEKQYFNLNEGAFFKENLLVKNQNSCPQHADYFNYHPPTLDSYFNNESCLSENFVLSKEVDVSSKPSWSENVFVKNLEDDKIFLFDLLNQSATDEHLGELLLSFKERFIVIKDIIQPLANKIIEITKSRKLLLMDTEFSNLTALWNDINADITKLLDDVVLYNSTRENKTCYSHFRQNISGNSYMSAKEKMDLVKEECLQISSHSKALRKSAEEGKYLIDMLRREVNKIKQGSLEKDAVINDLKNAVSDWQNKMKEQKKEINSCLSNINNMVVERAHLENEVKLFTDQFSRLCVTISECDSSVPITTSSIVSIIEHVRQLLKQSVENKGLLSDLTENITFFTSQCRLLISYVEDVEKNHSCIQKENTRLIKEVDILNTDFIRAKNYIDEADMFLKDIISNLPSETSSIQQAKEVAKQIFSEYITLKGKEKDQYNEQKTNQNKLVQQLKDISSLEIYNSNLKLQLERYENDIRNLRSELRNLRSQWRRKEKSRANEKQVQTEHLCCREFQDQILKLEELAEARSREITSLKLDVINENQPHKKKVSELECELLQAKERIRNLRFELTKNKNFTKEIIEAYNEKFEKAQLKEQQESEILSSSQIKN